MSVDTAPTLMHDFHMAPRRNKRAATRIRELLNQWMDKNDLSRVQAADRLGVSLKTIDRWMRGESAPWDAQITKIAPIMGFKPEEFYEEPAPVNLEVVERVEILEGQFSEGLEDLDERLSAVEQILGVVPGDGKEAREIRARRVEELLAGEIARAQPQSQRRRASGRTSKATKPRRSPGRSPQGAGRSSDDSA
jgi:transcriptional regulator with XRE-family HTH domain